MNSMLRWSRAHSGLTEQYGSRLDPKYKWIQTLGIILLLIAAAAVLLMVLILYCGHMVIKSLPVLLSLAIIINIIFDLSWKLGLIIITLYWFWSLTLQFYKGIAKGIWFIISSVFTIVILLALPNLYDPAVGHLAYNRGNGFVNETKYLGKLISHSDRTKTITLTVRSGDVQKCKMKKLEYNLYKCIDIARVGKAWDPHGYLILSHDDGERLYGRLKWSGESEVSFTYNADTRIVTDYQVLGKSEDNDKSSLWQGLFPEMSTENIPEQVEIRLTKRRASASTNEEVLLIERPEIKNYDGEIYWYVTKNGEFYECYSASYKTWNNFLHFEKEGEFTITLVVNYNEITGNYTPISNTIEYTVKS